MIEVEDLQIDDCYGVDFLYITFKVSDMIKPPESYRMDLYRAVNQSALFEMIAGDIGNYRFTDYSVNLLNPNIQYFYKIVITDIETKETSTSDIYRYGVVQPDRWALAISEIEKKYVEDVLENKEAYLLQKRRTGARCQCWNPNREAVDNQYCEICYGTGFVGGYYKATPISIGNYNASTYQRATTVFDDADIITTQQIWTRNFPKIETDDIIIDGDVRYIITSHTDTTKNHYLIRQICTMELVPKSSIISRVPVIGG